MGKQICVSLDGVEVYENEEAYEVEQLKKHANWLEKELDKQRHKKASCQIHIGELEQLCRDMYKMLAFALDGEPGELASQADLAKSIHDRMVSYDLMLDEWKRSE